MLLALNYQINCQILRSRWFEHKKFWVKLNKTSTYIFLKTGAYITACATYLWPKAWLMGKLIARDLFLPRSFRGLRKIFKTCARNGMKDSKCKRIMRKTGKKCFLLNYISFQPKLCWNDNETEDKSALGSSFVCVFCFQPLKI